MTIEEIDSKILLLKNKSEELKMLRDKDDTYQMGVKID